MKAWGTKEHSSGKTPAKSDRDNHGSAKSMGEGKAHLMKHMKEVDIKLVGKGRK